MAEYDITIAEELKKLNDTLGGRTNVLLDLNNILECGGLAAIQALTSALVEHTEEMQKMGRDLSEHTSALRQGMRTMDRHAQALERHSKALEECSSELRHNSYRR